MPGKAITLSTVHQWEARWAFQMMGNHFWLCGKMKASLIQVQSPNPWDKTLSPLQ